MTPKQTHVPLAGLLWSYEPCYDISPNKCDRKVHVCLPFHNWMILIFVVGVVVAGGLLLPERCWLAALPQKRLAVSWFVARASCLVIMVRLESAKIPFLRVHCTPMGTFGIRFLHLLSCFFCFRLICYRNFRTFTRTADYPQRSIFVIRRKNVQQITRTGLLPAPQNQRKSCYCIMGIRTHKLGAINIPWVWIPLKPRKHFWG